MTNLLSSIKSSISPVATTPVATKKPVTSFKSVTTPFGKMWGYNGIITVSIQPNVNKDLVKGLSDGAKLGEDEFMKAMVASTKEYFKKASYKVENTNAKTVMEMLPKKLVEDLVSASQLGMKKQYNLHIMKSKENNYFIILEAIRFIPKANGGFNTPKAKPTGSNEVIWTNIGTEASNFNEVSK